MRTGYRMGTMSTPLVPATPAPCRCSVPASPIIHPGELNYLEIAARSGATGLARALKDPNQVLPVLAGLGVAGAMFDGVDTESP